METIKRLDVNIRTNPPYTNPEITEFLINYKLGDEINLPITMKNKEIDYEKQYLQ